MPISEAFELQKIQRHKSKIKPLTLTKQVPNFPILFQHPDSFEQYL